MVHLSSLFAFVAAFFFGFLWYGPLFGRVWAGLMAFPADFKPTRPQMMKAMGLQVAGTILTVIVTDVFVSHARLAMTEAPPALPAFIVAALAWLGFKLPLQFGKVAWENRPWALLALNAIYDFLHLQLIALILAYG